MTGGRCGLGSAMRCDIVIAIQAVAPMMKKGSLPETTGLGSGVSGDSGETSPWHAQKHKNGRRSGLRWSPIVPRSIG